MFFDATLNTSSGIEMSLGLLISGDFAGELKKKWSR